MLTLKPQTMRPPYKKILRFFLYLFALLFITSFCYTLYLKWFPPITTPTMVIRGFEKDQKINANFCTWVSSKKISDYAKLAVIASEDQRFATHNGFDLDAIQKAMKHNKKSKRIRGGSTISQQVAKNLFLWPGRSYLRKGLEVYFTVLIELLWSKERILQMYLNIAETGNGFFGIEAAAQNYYHKPASKLTASESAMIAATLPNPRIYNAIKPNTLIRKRQARILRHMRSIGWKKYLEQI